MHKNILVKAFLIVFKSADKLKAKDLMLEIIRSGNTESI